MSSTEINPFDACETSGYEVNGDVVAELARIGASGDAVTSKVGGTYLRVLVASAQRHLAGIDTGHPSAQPRAVDAANAAYYPYVLKGITTADCADNSTLYDRAERSRRSLERNRRSNFARTAASTLRTWVSVGGDLETLHPAHITKAHLIEDISKARAKARDSGAAYASVVDTSAVAPLNEVERALARTFKRMVRHLSAIKATSPDRAAFLAARLSDGITNSYGAK